MTRTGDSWDQAPTALRRRSRRPAADGGARAGFTLPELLVVLAIIGLAVLVSVPLASQKLREIRARSAAGEFATGLRAARMAAVALGRDVEVQIEQAPLNRWRYEDVGGRVREVQPPQGVSITASPPQIVFGPAGQVRPEEETLETWFEVELQTDVIDRWIVALPLGGIPRIGHQRLHSQQQTTE